MSDSLSQHITTLLRRHDCVIVPGVGAFVATAEPASITDEMLTPPARRVSFNAELLHDDGLLASSYARRMKISFEQARERVAAEAALLHRRLKAEGIVNISRVGALHRRAGGRLEFMPFALWTLTLPAVGATKAEPQFEVVKPEVATPDKAVAVVRVPLRMRWIRVAAAAVILFAAAFTLSTPISLENAQHASLAAPSFTAPAEEFFANLEEPKGQELKIAMPSVAPVTVDEPVVISKPERCPYVVVIASLPSREKAEAFMAQQGINTLEILQSGDKFRIYAAQGNSPEEAMNNLGVLSTRYTDAWVCRR